MTGIVRNACGMFVGWCGMLCGIVWNDSGMITA